MIRAIVVFAIVYGASAVAHAGKRDCVAIGKGKAVYADASKRRPVGTTTKKVAAEVVRHKGAWVKVRFDATAEIDDGGHYSNGHVEVYVRKRDTQRGACPPFGRPVPTWAPRSAAPRARRDYFSFAIAIAPASLNLHVTMARMQRPAPQNIVRLTLIVSSTTSKSGMSPESRSI